MRCTFVVLALACLSSARPSHAQTLYTFDPTATVSELTGPPGLPCAYPNGPVVGAFPALAGPCPAPVAFAPPLGDVALDVVTNIVYLTNGPLIGAYTPAGVHLGSVPSPLPGLTGLAVNAPGALLWITDGVAYGALALPLPLCVAVPAFAVGPFPVPIGPIFAGPIGDLDWETASASLVGCDATGLVGSFLPGPLPAAGPYGVFPAGPCVPGPLFGIAFDRALPGTGTVTVTNGVGCARLVAGGAPAPPAFYAPLPCFPSPIVPPIAGLTSSGHQITFGVGADTTALPPPLIGGVGNSYPGNPAYGVTLAGSVPGGTAFLRYSFGAACPPPLVLGLPVYLAAPRFAAITLPVGAGGGAVFTTALPAFLPPGVPVHLQWIVLTGASVQVTAGGRFTTVLP